jgi:hypothetical protein
MLVLNELSQWLKRKVEIYSLNMMNKAGVYKKNIIRKSKITGDMPCQIIYLN